MSAHVIPVPAAKSTVEEHIENLLSIKAITPKTCACWASSPLPTEPCALLVPIPIVGCPLVPITQGTEGL